MSPIEDEACVAEILREAKGDLELVDAREFLPNFKARPGLTTWHVLDDYKLRKAQKEDSVVIPKSEGDGEGEDEIKAETPIDPANASTSVPSTTDPLEAAKVRSR